MKKLIIAAAALLTFAEINSGCKKTSDTLASAPFIKGIAFSYLGKSYKSDSVNIYKYTWGDTTYTWTSMANGFSFPKISFQLHRMAPGTYPLGVQTGFNDYGSLTMNNTFYTVDGSSVSITDSGAYIKGTFRMKLADGSEINNGVFNVPYTPQ